MDRAQSPLLVVAHSDLGVAMDDVATLAFVRTLMAGEAKSSPEEAGPQGLGVLWGAVA